MSILYIALPVALVVAAIAVIAFIVQVHSGQYDDLETPPRKILFDDVAGKPKSMKQDNGPAGEQKSIEQGRN
ncbi:MAG: cbb3-type cytochrome oxidase assembly protein CcoS [Planctomycetota bacterium]